MSEASPHIPEYTGSLRERLRNARDRQGLDLADISELTNVRREYLSALEEGRYGDLPEDVYTRNFLKLFALAIGEKPEPLLALFTDERAKSQEPDEAQLAVEEDLRNDSRQLSQLNLGPWLSYLLLISAVVLLVLWGFNTTLFRSGRGSQSQIDPGQVSEALPDEGFDNSGEDPSAPNEETRISLFTIITDPPGAEVSIDSFTLANVTPIENAPITALPSRRLLVSLEGYKVYQQQVDLSSDRRLQIALTPQASREVTTDIPHASTSGGNIVITITATTWLEVFKSGARNKGERLVYTTVEPPEQFEFQLPVYIHAGNGIGVHLAVGDQDLGPLGGSGEVLGRPFTR
jgi:cytoskeleton protein RodZ